MIPDNLEMTGASVINQA
jgi:hypothetical protein